MELVYEKVPLDESRPYRLWVRSEPVFAFQWHYHPEYELTWIIRGHGTRVVGDQVGDFQDGDLVLLGPHLPHTWSSHPAPAGTVENEGDHEAWVLQFSRTFPGDAILKSIEGRSMTALLERSCRGVRFRNGPDPDMKKRMLHAVRHEGMERILTLIDILNQLSVRDDVDILASESPAESKVSDGTHPIDRIYAYIHEHCTESLSVDRLAEQFRMSASTLHRTLKKATGRTLTELVNELRINRACGLLLQGEGRISEVCYQCGFQNLSYFNRRFREHRGITPRAYRDRMKLHHRTGKELRP